MKTLEWYLKNNKEKLKGATVRDKRKDKEGVVIPYAYDAINPKIIKVLFDNSWVWLFKPSSLELVSLNNNNINEEIYKTMEINVINQDVIKANTVIKVMWQGDDFAYNCIVQYSTEKYIHCYGLSAETNKIERYAISADDLESGKVMILEIMEG